MREAYWDARGGRSLAGAVVGLQTATYEPGPDVCGGTLSVSASLCLGDALRKAEAARFARAMGTWWHGSVPLVQCIKISGANPKQSADREFARKRRA